MLRVESHLGWMELHQTLFKDREVCVVRCLVRLFNVSWEGVVLPKRLAGSMYCAIV